MKKQTPHYITETITALEREGCFAQIANKAVNEAIEFVESQIDFSEEHVEAVSAQIVRALVTALLK